MKDKCLLNLLLFLFKGIACLPFCILYLLSDVIYFIVYYIVGYRKSVVHANLANAFPEKTADEIMKIERNFYRHFCDYIVETLKLLHISDKETKRRLRIMNPEIIEELRQGDNRPIFLYLGHYGNWEYVTSIMLWLREGLDGFHVYHPLSNKLMDRFFLKLRSRFHTTGVPSNLILKYILNSVRSGKQPILGLIADQRPRKKFCTTWMKFLNQETPIITGGEVMGKRLNAHYVYIKTVCVRRGYYELTLSVIHPNESEEFSVTKQFMRLLEKDIQVSPQYWLWSHKRWKFSYNKMFPGKEFPE